MKIVDTRSGAVIKVGDTVRYPNDPAADYTLLDVEPGYRSATATLRTQHGVVLVPLTVRFFHPSFFGQHVGFVPS